MRRRSDKRKHGSKSKGSHIDSYYATRGRRAEQAKARRKIKLNNVTHIPIDYIETEIDK